MGVKQLWNILEPVKEKQTLSDLTNKTLSVDLSFWICEALGAKDLCQHVNKPHLRNLLLRLLKFTEFRVKLVFVVDGRPPELKLETIRKRNEIQTRGGKIFGSGSEREIRSEGSGFAKCVSEVSVTHTVSFTLIARNSARFWQPRLFLYISLLFLYDIRDRSTYCMSDLMSDGPVQIFGNLCYSLILFERKISVLRSFETFGRTVHKERRRSRSPVRLIEFSPGKF